MFLMFNTLIFTGNNFSFISIFRFHCNLFLTIVQLDKSTVVDI